MSCNVQGCPGEYEDRALVLADRVGAGIIVIEGVPAQVCAVCGDELLALRTVERLQALRRTPPPPTRFAPLYDFATAEAAVAAEVAVP